MSNITTVVENFTRYSVEDLLSFKLALSLGWKIEYKGVDIDLESALNIAKLGDHISFVKSFIPEEENKKTFLWLSNYGWQMASLIDNKMSHHFIKKGKVNEMPLRFMLNITPKFAVNRD